MKFEVVRSLEEEAWRQFLMENPAATIFHTPEFFQLFNRVKGHKSHLWAVLDRAGQAQALLTPVEITLVNGLLSRLTTRMVAYGSLLYAPTPPGQDALVSLLQEYKSQTNQEALFTELRNLSDLTEIQPILKAHNFKYEDHLNYLIDLDRPPQEIMQSIGRRTRKQIRRGLRQGKVTISEVTERKQLGAWYKLLKRTYSLAHVPLSDISLFEAAFDIFYQRRMIKFLMAIFDGKLVSCSAELLFKDVIYGWYGGTDREFSSYVPNELLIWYILEWGAANGYRLYDFGGAGKPDEDYGVRDFKAKFGGELVNFGRNMYVHQPNLLKISKLGYEIYHRFL